MSPLLSIIIPTKDRYRTLFFLVEKLMTWKENEFEIVVQDNTLDNSKALESFKSYFSDNRFKYFHTEQPISGLENAQLAIDNSKGEYVCYLGDDDGIIFQAIAFTKYMKENGIESLNCKHGSYCWPEYRYKNHGKKLSLAGFMIYRKFSGTIEYLNPLKELELLLDAGGLTIGRVPRLYHGIISRNAINKVKEVTGTYFPGPTPDMASAVALSFYIKKHIYVDYPIIIAGASANSMAGRGGQQKSHGKIEEELTLPIGTAENWSKELPRYWAPQTIWPESALQALKKTGNSVWVEKMNFTKIFAELYVDTPSYRDELMQFININLPNSKQNDFKKTMRKYKYLFYMAKFKYQVKIWFVYFNLDKLLGLTRLRADNVRDAISKLEMNSENLIANGKIFSNINQFKNINNKD